MKHKNKFIAKGVGAGRRADTSPAPTRFVRGESAITLIALVITIIVLLILAGVTIAMVVGDNGILTRAKEAKSATEIAEENEKRELARAEAAMNMENTTYEGITIPAGFAPTRIDGENKVEDGLVITDSEGNEFVWIPWEDITDEKYKEAQDMVIDKNWSHNDAYVSNGGTDGKGWSDDYSTDDKNILDKQYTGENVLPTEDWIKEKQTDVAKTSIVKYKGFYVARYEAGIPKEATGFYVLPDEKENLTYTIDGRGNIGETNKIKSLSPVSKKGVQAWNFITQPNAKLVAENMYAGSSSVGSYLIDSGAWNHICDGIFNGRDESKSITNSSNWGNYKDNKTTNYNAIEGLWAQHEYVSSWGYASDYNNGKVNLNPGGTNRIELETGASEDFKNYNIYDMAGNMWEWTTAHNINETKTNMFAVPRGR